MDLRGFVVRTKRQQKKGWQAHTQNQDLKKGPILYRRMSAPTVGAQVFGGVLCPLLALEVRPMFQARGQAREKRDIKHREEETLVQASPCSLIADIEHHTWFFDISCDQVDFKCVPCCLPRSCRKHSGNVCFISLLAFPWCCICNGKKVFNLPACGVLRIGALPLVFGLHSVAHCIVA